MSQLVGHARNGVRFSPALTRLSAAIAERRIGRILPTDTILFRQSSKSRAAEDALYGSRKMTTFAALAKVSMYICRFSANSAGNCERCKLTPPPHFWELREFCHGGYLPFTPPLCLDRLLFERRRQLPLRRSWPQYRGCTRPNSGWRNRDETTTTTAGADR
jgi:hypothetical protein